MLPGVVNSHRRAWSALAAFLSGSAAEWQRRYREIAGGQAGAVEMTTWARGAVETWLCAGYWARFPLG
jgi:hypothetical protein